MLTALKRALSKVIKVEKEFRFRSGFRETGYRKMRVAAGTWPLPWEMLVLHMPPGSVLPAHRDVGRGKFGLRRYYKVNLVVRKAKAGGEFYCDRAILKLGRLAVFRADTQMHGVTKVAVGDRYVLSLGFTLAPRPGEIIERAKMGRFVDPA